jgi:hypothetical protein
VLFETRDLMVKIYFQEREGLWAMGCGGCDSTAPKPACHPPSAPCKPPSHPCAAESRKAEAFDSRTAGLLALRQQLQSALAPAG